MDAKSLRPRWSSNAAPVEYDHDCDTGDDIAQQRMNSWITNILLYFLSLYKRKTILLWTKEFHSEENLFVTTRLTCATIEGIAFVLAELMLLRMWEALLLHVQKLKISIGIFDLRLFRAGCFGHGWRTSCISIARRGGTRPVTEGIRRWDRSFAFVAGTILKRQRSPVGSEWRSITSCGCSSSSRSSSSMFWSVIVSSSSLSSLSFASVCSRSPLNSDCCCLANVKNWNWTSFDWLLTGTYWKASFWLLMTFSSTSSSSSSSLGS